MKRPTTSRLADIAAYAGVSEATVSRVLNDRPGVAAATRQAVVTAVDVLGYERPSKLRRSSAGLIGLVVPELTNPIFPAFAQAVETQLAAAGYTPVLCTQTPGGVHEDEYVQMLLERGVASILFISGLHADTSMGVERYCRLLDQGLPIALVNGVRPEVPTTFVSTDEAAGVRLAVRHLRDLGHTRIGLATGPARYVPVQRKREGYREAMADLLGEGDPDELLETTVFTVEGGSTAGAALVERGATAIVCGSDLMALGVVRAARTRGLRVPEDLSVVGSDDSQLIAFTDPPLTTIRQDVTGISSAAVAAVLQGIAGERGEHREYLYAPDLILRGSTGAAPR